MFAYYVRLAVRSFRRNKVLTALMVVAIALGIGASMTTLTVFHVLSGDPIPGKSDRLFYVQLDPRPKSGYVPGEEPEEQMTRFDAEAMLRDKRAQRQAVMTAGGATIVPESSTLKPFSVDSRYTSADFFPMFDVPFQYGNPWTAADDEGRGRVVVLSKALNDKVFNGANSVGRNLTVSGHSLRVVGVLKAWQPQPRFFDLSFSAYGQEEDVLMPFSTSIDLKMGSSGNMNCFGDGSPDGSSYDLNAPCTWLQYWVELDPAKADDFRQYLVNYSDQQRAAGRFQRPANTRLSTVMEWLDYKKAVPSDVRLQVWLALGFLVVCLINTVGLLLAKFLRRSGEIGVRRALGASRGQIFLQCVVEAGAVGVAGGLLGIGLALIGLYAVRQQPVEYAKLAHLDGSMLVLAIGLTLFASLAAGMLPAWRAMQVTPAIQLKSQ
ncbi:ABC transporter permease [Stenotrophomonas sp. CFBP 13724]|jgi:putative ABC transport system permease protein|uniref:ABC transporter permease n=1 Tax=Stenotrophomonas sp. CFBP 13724 TaxID=2775298 RepID=UPI0005AF3961|nr:ABC transporter permease [Stenotrophomonas sp. CFBP 13724]KIP83020.1 ABC transporter ATP-binding protein [Stenotrophomonas maltophilia]MBD8641998.1 ABC transporter permease [Stenotrophomonas sp. CFBP 13724]